MRRGSVLFTWKQGKSLTTFARDSWYTLCIEVMMATLFADTAPEIEAIQLAHLREMPAYRKLALVGEMYCSVRTLAVAGLRLRYPNDTPAQHQRRLADLLLGQELAQQAYGPLLEE